MANKQLFIDGQVFQSAAWDRGMGKYSLALLKAILADRGNNYKEIYIIFTKHLDLPTGAKKLIKQVAPEAKHIFTDLKIPDDPSSFDVAKFQKANREVLDAAIGLYSQADGNAVDFMIMSLFIDQVCSTFPTQGKKILLFYDLIPLQYDERYGKLSSYPNYLARFKTIFEADAILTISQTVADDVALYLGISSKKIFNIDGAPIERSTLAPRKPDIRLPNRYVLMPSGDDLRKNNLRAVQGFEAYRQISQDNDVSLLITSSFHTVTQRDLKAYSDNIVFTGNVSEEELHWLYANASALLFVSEYEGLGLPILEAAEVSKPIVCSNLTVFNEISPTAFYYADQFDSYSIGSSLTAAMDKKDFNTKAKEYPDILKRYTWENTAKKAVAAIQTTNANTPAIKKIRLAVFSPTPSGYSAIGKLVMQLHPAMSRYFDIDYYLEEGKSQQPFTRSNYLPFIAQVFPADDFDKNKYKQYDAVLYHIGNSEFHLETIKNALYLPGYAVFHDTYLTDVFEGPLVNYNYISRDRLEAEALLDKKIKNPRASYISSLANNQLGLIAHSAYTQAALQKSCIDSATPTLKTNLPTATPKQIIRRLQKEHVTIGLAGIIHPAKGLEIIEAIAQSDKFYECQIHIFGLSLVTEEVINRLEAYPNVTVDTNVTDFQFQSMLSQLDILVNFRTQYRGETSMATIEAMRFGVIPIVKKVGWYNELPDNSVVKVADQNELMTELELLIADQPRRQKMKAAARQLIAQSFNYEAYAKNLYEFLLTETGSGQPTEISNAIKKGASLQQLKNVTKLLQKENDR
jgi:glycosyltransferase involved in cell wall biosynthesis